MRPIIKKSNDSSIYNASFTSGSSLMLTESRHIAQLLLNNSSKEQWHQAIVVDNILQKRSPDTARRINNLIRARLETMTSELWKIIIEGDSVVTTQALLACAIKHSRLIGDFLEQVLKENLRVFKPELSKKDWNDFLDGCGQQAPEVGHWSKSTKQKMGQVVFRILAEAQYIDNLRKPVVKPIHLENEVLNYLKQHHENYVLRCMDIGSQDTQQFFI
ncbi:DUF1819 family protein [Deltaproteobacteria bacterium TL4]